MASTHDTAFAAQAAPVLLSQFGESVIWTAPDGTETAVTAMCYEREPERTEQANVEYLQRRATFEVDSTAVDLTVWRAGADVATVTWGGEVWGVEERPVISGGLATVQARRKEEIRAVRTGTIRGR